MSLCVGRFNVDKRIKEMTNRQTLMRKLNQMSDEDFAALFRAGILDYIYVTMCKSCKVQNSGLCLMEKKALENCPIDLVDWLSQQAL